MIIPKFRAVYNIFTKQLAVLYGNCVIRHTFTEMEEWIKVSYNGDPDHPNYLHVQIDYDEEFQLLFYPREDNDESLHEDEGTFFHSSDLDSEPEHLLIVYNDQYFNMALRILNLAAKLELTLEEGNF